VKVDVNRLKPYILSPYPGLNQVGPIVREAFAVGDDIASPHLVGQCNREVKVRPANSLGAHVVLIIYFWQKSNHSLAEGNTLDSKIQRTP
jgi:hypothetical protein